MNLLYTTAVTKSAEGRTITGWASRGDIVDRDGEIILPVAWQRKDSLTDFLRHPVLCAFHRYDQLPLGKVTDIQATDKGLKFKAAFADTAAAEEALRFIRSTGGLASFSVGFQPVSHSDLPVSKVAAMGFDVSTVTKDTIRCYDYCRLLEVSLCALPSCPTCTIIGAAFERGEIREKSLQAALGVWKNGYEKKRDQQEIVEMVKELIKPTIFDAVSKELQTQGIILEETIKACKYEILRRKGRVVSDDPGELEKFWPTKKKEQAISTENLNALVTYLINSMQEKK